MIKYEVKHEEREIGYVHRGATYEHGDIACCQIWNCNTYNPEIIASFDTKEEALAELHQHKCSSWEAQGQLGKLLFAEEYWVEEVDYDEEGMFNMVMEVVEVA